MKLALLIISFLLFQNLSAQQYESPFPDSNAIWIQSRTVWDVTNQAYSVCGAKLFSHDTTIYNGKTYHNLYFEDYDYNPSNHFSFLWQENVTQEKIGMFHIDSLKVYYKPLPNSVGYPCFTGDPFVDADPFEEYLLYDFSLNVGDTFYVQEDHRSVLVNIDSINIDGTYYRRFKFNQLDWWFTLDNFWIEGIGSSLGFFPYFSAHHGFYAFSCFHEDTDTSLTDPLFSYSNSTYGCSFVGIDQHNTEQFRIYPNPAHNNLTVDHKHPFEYQVLNVSGQVLLEGKMNSENKTINVSNLSKGYYLLRVSEDTVIPFIKD